MTYSRGLGRSTDPTSDLLSDPRYPEISGFERVLDPFRTGPCSYTSLQALKSGHFDPFRIKTEIFMVVFRHLIPCVFETSFYRF